MAASDDYRQFMEADGAFLFLLEIENRVVGHFKECSGIKNTTEVVEVVEGGVNYRVHKLPGQTRWENITLRYGSSPDSYLLDWRNEVLQDQFKGRRNGSIVLMANDMTELRRYSFMKAWPVSYEGPSIKADSSDLAVESIEIAHSGINVVIA